MKLSLCSLAALLSTVHAASWTFGAAKIDISGTPYPFDPSSAPISAILQPEDKFKVLLTTKVDDEAKRPHQAMLLVKDSHSTLEANLVIPVKANGRGALTIAYKDLGPILTTHDSVDLTLVLGGFGETVPLLKHIATLTLAKDSSATTTQEATQPLRYGALPEITHTFRAQQQLPPKIISIAFSAIIAFGLIGLFAAWSSIGVNTTALSSSLSAAPISYTVFLASLAGIQVVLYLYWSHWRIMSAIGSILGLGVPLFFSGRFALREVEARRKAGAR